MPEWIDQPEQLAPLWEHLRAEPVVSLDTESDQMHAYKPTLCLLQIATARREVLVDPLRLPEGSLKPLGECLESPNTVKIIHAADNDMRLLQRQFGFRINNLFDTQEAARFLNHPRTGLATLLEHYLNISHNKKFQQTNWRHRPLHPDEIEYAGMDVRHLISLREHLTDALASRCLAVPFAQNCEALTRKDYNPSAEFDVEKFRKMRGARDLRGRSRALLKALYLWRHGVCEQLNRSPFMVIEDHFLVEISARKPRTMAELSDNKRIPQKLIRRYGAQIVEVIQQAWDAPVPPMRPPPDGSEPHWRARVPAQEAAALNALLDWRSEASSKDELEGALVASKRVLERLAKERPQNLDELVRVCSPDWLDWQIERYAQDVLRVLK